MILFIPSTRQKNKTTGERAGDFENLFYGIMTVASPGMATGYSTYSHPTTFEQSIFF
jgi:hypothetical protein